MSFLCWCTTPYPCYIAVATLYHSHCSPVWSQRGEYMQSPVPLSLKPLHVGHLMRTLNLWKGTSHIEHFKCSTTKLRPVKWWIEWCKIKVIHQQSTHKFMIFCNLSPLMLMCAFLIFCGKLSMICFNNTNCVLSPLWSLTPSNNRFYIFVVS